MNKIATSLRKFLACTLSASVFFVSIPAQSFASGVPAWVGDLTPSTRFGRVIDHSGSPNAPLVILIQDLHFNRGVQRNIAGLIDFYEKKLPDTPVAVEGASGKLDYQALVNYPHPEWKRDLVKFLVVNAEITGPEAYAIQSNRPSLLTGIEDQKFFSYHLELFRRSFDLRSQLHLSVLSLAQQIETLRRTLGKDRKNPELAESIQIASKEIALLEALLAQRVTFEEARHVAQRLPRTLQLIDRLAPALDQPIRISRAEVEEAVQTSIDFYAAALVRDEPLAENTVALLNGGPRAVIQVAGGFHTAGMTRLLKQKGLRYIVVEPVVRENTVEDEARYIERLLGRHTTSAAAERSARTSTLGITGAILRSPGKAVVGAWTRGREWAVAHPKTAMVLAAASALPFLKDHPESLAGGLVVLGLDVRPDEPGRWNPSVARNDKSLYAYAREAIEHRIHEYAAQTGFTVRSTADLKTPQGQDLVSEMSSFPLRAGLNPETDLDVAPMDIQFKREDVSAERRKEIAGVILRGGIMHQMVFAGEASRLKKDLLSKGIEVTDEELAAMYFVDLGFLNGQARSMPMGPRQLLQLRLEIERLADEYWTEFHITPAQAVANQKILFHLNEKTADAIGKDLVDHQFYGFEPGNIVVIPQHVDQPFDFVDGKLVPANLEEPVALGHGWATLQALMQGVGYQLNKRGDYRRLQRDALQFFIDQGVAVAHQYRINDLYNLTPGIIELEYLAMEYGQIREQKSFYLARMVTNLTGQKGGIPLRPTKEGWAGTQLIIADTLSTSDVATRRYMNELTTQVPFHRFANTFHIGRLRSELLTHGLTPDFELKNFPVFDGNGQLVQKPLINPQFVTGMVTTIPGLLAKTIHQEGQVLQDFKALGNLKEGAALWNAQTADTGFQKISAGYRQSSTVKRSAAQSMVGAVRQTARRIGDGISGFVRSLQNRWNRRQILLASPLARALDTPQVQTLLTAPAEAAVVPAPAAQPRPSRLANKLRAVFRFTSRDDDRMKESYARILAAA